jgi:surfactin synthase thioesterase subunit
VFENVELLDLLLPTLRADFAAVESYQHRARPALAAAPLVAYAGADDTVVDVAEVEPWCEHTRAPCHVRTIAGGHFFILDDPASFVARLADDVRAVVLNGGPAR